VEITSYHNSMLDDWTELWWNLYGDKPYVMRPDGYQAMNTARIGPQYLEEYLVRGLGQETEQWFGWVSPESIFVACDGGKVQGILITSVNYSDMTGNILSAFAERNQRGLQITHALLKAALSYFRKLDLREAITPTSCLEVESPIYLSLLEEGFAWHDNWEQGGDTYGDMVIRAYPGHLVYMGRLLEDFELKPEIKQSIECLHTQGVDFEVLSVDQLSERPRADTGKPPDELNPKNSIPSSAAIVDGSLVGWIGHIGVAEEDSGMAARACGIHVIPDYRRRGIGKVLYHLGIQAMVGRGAEYGYGSAGICSPSRLILHSAGYQCWHIGFMPMTKSL